MFKRIILILILLVSMAGASFSADGNFDSAFDGDGVAVYHVGSTATMGYAVASQQDGKIVVAGSIAGSLSVFRYNNNGTLDNTFYGDGIATYGSYGFGHGVAIQHDGKIVVVGESDWDAVILRYNSDGTLDSSFGGRDGIVTYDMGTDDITFFAVALQTDGKIVVAGFADYPAYQTLVLRYNSDGTLDNTFSSDGVVTYQNNYYENGHDCGLAIQSDGKIVVATGYAFNGYDSNILVLRYDSNGTLDSTFSGDGIVRYNGTAAGADYGHAVAIQPDGKIVVVGETINGANFDVIILRFNSNGTLDSTFSGDGIATYDSGSYDYGRAVAIQADGKIVVVGSNYNPWVEGNILILRYDKNGILDKTFGNDGVVKYDSGISDFYDGNAVVDQPDGKIVVTGGIRNYGDVLTLRLVSPLCECRFDTFPPPIQILPGGSLRFWATVSNDTDEVQTFDFATNVKLPNGNKYPSSGWLMGPISITLDPHTSKSKYLIQKIPYNAPYGIYTYRGYVGMVFPPLLYNQCQFSFEVVR